MEPLYQHPEIYDWAFSWRDHRSELGVLFELWSRFGHGRLERVLDLACGSAPLAPGFLASGLGYVGVDPSPTMLAAGRQRAPGARFVQATVTDFALEERSDLACCLLGSLYLDDADGFHRHLDRVAQALRPGALYLLDWCVLFDDPGRHHDSWVLRDGARSCRVRYRMCWLDRQRQLAEERLTVEVEERGMIRRYQERTSQRVFFADEFRGLLESRADFAFVGWWNDWDLDQPLPVAAVERPIVLLRRH